MEQNKKIKKIETHESVEVLYQKMGDRWFAFSLIDDEVYTGSISQDEMHETEINGQAFRKKIPRPS